MSAATPALFAASAGVGFGHAILPDHWVPLAVIGRTRRYPLRRVARLSLIAGIAHVLVSIVIGAVIIVVGLRLRSTVKSAQDTIIGCLLIGTGIAYAVLDATRGHGRGHAHEHDRDVARALGKRRDGARTRRDRSARAGRRHLSEYSARPALTCL